MEQGSFSEKSKFAKSVQIYKLNNFFDLNFVTKFFSLETVHPVIRCRTPSNVKETSGKFIQASEYRIYNDTAVLQIEKIVLKKI